MAEMDKKASGIEAISDDELEAVAGGAGGGELTLAQAKEAAKAEGRKKQVPARASKPAGKMCGCPVEWKFYKSAVRTNIDQFTIYQDVKCYKCNAAAKEIKV